MSIAEDIKVLEEALDAFDDPSKSYGAAGSAWRFAAEPARIKRLVEALKEAEKRAETLEDLVSKYCSKYDD